MAVRDTERRVRAAATGLGRPRPPSSGRPSRGQRPGRPACCANAVWPRELGRPGSSSRGEAESQRPAGRQEAVPAGDTRGLGPGSAQHWSASPRSRGRSFRCVSAEAPETQACPRGCTHSRSAPPGAPSRSATGADDSGRVGTAAGRSLHSSGGRRLPDGGNHPWGRTVQSPESGLHHLQAQHSRGAGVLSLSVPRFTPLYRGSSAAPRGC